jgi:hypothetical protein
VKESRSCWRVVGDVESLVECTVEMITEKQFSLEAVVTQFPEAEVIGTDTTVREDIAVL